jgi:hypothetical protein
MKTYFNNMNTYHISYAAYGNNDGVDKKDYIRARRYMPEAKKGMNNTALKPDYNDTGLFEPGVPHAVTIIKKGSHLFMHISSKGKEMLCHWDASTHPSISEGRIGLRHMYTRSARYSNFRISGLNNHKHVAEQKKE